MHPFALYMQRQMGAPVVGYDDPNAAAAALAGMEYGGWLQNAGRSIGQVFRPRCPGGPGGGMPPGGPNGGGGMFRRRPRWGDDDDGYGDLTDELDEYEVGADEADVEALGADDEAAEVGWGADDDGGSAEWGAIGNRIQKIQAKIDRLEAKLAATPPFKFRKRQRLQAAIQRAKAHLSKKEAKRDRKAALIAKRLGIPAAALAGGAGLAGAAAAAGVSPGIVQAQAQAVNTELARKALGLGGDVLSSPGQWREVRVPFVDSTTGSQVSVVAIGAGAGLRTAAINMVTQPITYADFEIVGIDTDLRANEVLAGGGAAGEILLNMLLASVVPNGGLNLLYQTENVAFGAQTTNGQLSCARTIPGIRAQQMLRANNTAALAATLRQEVGNTFTITATFQAALVVRVLRDDNVRAAA